MLRAIVFDFDGVIANSEPLHFQAYRDVLADEGVTLTEADYYAWYLGFDDVGVFEALSVDPSGFHACGLTAAHQVYCWGNNGQGQLGDGTLTNRSTPVAVLQ